MNIAVVLPDIQEAKKELARHTFTGARLHFSPAATKKADIIFGEPLLVAPHLSAAHKLQWCHSSFAGIDAFMAHKKRGYALSRTGGVYGPAMAEYVISHIVHIRRDMYTQRKEAEKKIWRRRAMPTLMGLRLGIVGAGDIGRSIAKSAATFGMEVVGLKRKAGPVAGFSNVVGVDKKIDFLKMLDVIVCVLPGGAATQHFFDTTAFSAMKKDALFINIGRGSVVDEKSLIRVFSKRKAMHAVLDVCQVEPLPKKSELWTTANVHITSHTSGCISSPKIYDIFAENYTRFMQKRPLKYRVCWRRGY